MKIRISIWAIAAWLLAGSAWADVVYLRNGKTYEGEVTREGNLVIIRLAHDTVTVDAAQVSHIAPSMPPSDPAKETTEEAATTAAEETFPSQGPGLAELIPSDRLTRPESGVFLAMRKLAAASPSETAQLQTQLQQWQSMTHDRMRRTAKNWLSPRDFANHRRSFEKKRDEARELFKKAEIASAEEVTGPAMMRMKQMARNLQQQVDQTNPEALAEKKRQAEKNRQAGAKKLIEAAQSWADPSWRYFLLGAAQLIAEDYRQAEPLFRRAISLNSNVAAFHQGRGLSLLKLDRPLPATAAFTEVLRLRPGNETAMAQLQSAMQQVPGSQIKHADFQAASDLLARNENRSGRTRRQRPTEYARVQDRERTRYIWLLPGEDVLVEGTELPDLPFDRLAHQQAVAIPIGPDTLLVDGVAVNGAAEVFVRLDENTLVLAEVTDFPKSPANLSLLTIPGVAFTPVRPAPANPEAGTSVRMVAMNLYDDFGPNVRTVAATVTPASGENPLGLSAGLLPGESAAAVLTEEGTLLGFLAGKTDPNAENGGSDKLWLGENLTPQLKKSDSITARNAKENNLVPRPVSGEYFTVLAVFPERLVP